MLNANFCEIVALHKSFKEHPVEWFKYRNVWYMYFRKRLVLFDGEYTRVRLIIEDSLPRETAKAHPSMSPSGAVHTSHLLLNKIVHAWKTADTKRSKA